MQIIALQAGAPMCAEYKACKNGAGACGKLILRPWAWRAMERLC